MPQSRASFAASLLTGMLAGVTGIAMLTGPALAGDTQATQSSGEKQDSVTVESYETRPNPTHEVSLVDGRVYFVKKLEETEGGYVLHTLEDEVIEVDKTEVSELKSLD